MRPNLLRVSVFIAVLVVAGCAKPKGSPSDHPAEPAKKQAAPTPIAEVPDRWGIEIVSLRLTAAESMIDFRYRILDPDKAVFLVDRTIKAYLLDQETGKAVGVPNTAKIGPLRQTTKFGKPPADKIFFMLFSNPGRFIRPGAKVTLEIGEFRVEDLVLE